MTRLTTVLIVLLLVALANVWALIGVARNRSGRPEAVLHLTERELPVASTEREDTALYLRLSLTADRWDESERSWFDCEKLEAVGFDCGDLDVDDLESGRVHGEYRDQPARFAYAVLEFDGPTWDRWRDRSVREHSEMMERMIKGGAEEKEIEMAESSHERTLRTTSRLFPIDAGPEASELRARYPDRERHVVVPASVRIRTRSRVSQETGKITERWLEGDVVGPLVYRLHVPREHREILDRTVDPLGAIASRPSILERSRSPRLEAPRYRVEVRFGRRFEPWISSVAEIFEEESPIADSGLEREETVAPAADDPPPTPLLDEAEPDGSESSPRE